MGRGHAVDCCGLCSPIRQHQGPRKCSTGKVVFLYSDLRQRELWPQLTRSIKRNWSLKEILQMCIHILKPTENQCNYARWQRSKPICVFTGKVIAFRKNTRPYCAALSLCVLSSVKRAAGGGLRHPLCVFICLPCVQLYQIKGFIL